jgi:hypothetical protein
MRKALLVALVVSGSVGAVGCIGDIIEAQPSGMKPSPDMTSPGGGAVTFSTIQADIDSATVPACSSGACHGGGQPPVLKPVTDAAYSLQANYDSFMADVSTANPTSSKVLTKNLPSGGHAPGDLFTPKGGTDSDVYKRWLAWIQAGAPK